MAYACRILADHVNPVGNRIVSFEITFPRIVLAEFNTHRMLSRNSASSRAIPVEKQIARVEEDPFIPIHWGKNQRGMQAEEEITDSTELGIVTARWLLARDAAVVHARRFLELGVHKQITNRLLEPFQWHTAIVTATELENFFALRCHPAAQPEIRRIAEMMRDAMAASIPRRFEPGDWHLPLVGFDDEDLLLLAERVPLALDWARISAGRCARVSYLTHDGKRDPQADLDLYARLASSGHMSPLEHPARALHHPVPRGNLVGWESLRSMTPGEAVFRG